MVIRRARAKGRHPKVRKTPQTLIGSEKLFQRQKKTLSWCTSSRTEYRILTTGSGAFRCREALPIRRSYDGNGAGMRGISTVSYKGIVRSYAKLIVLQKGWKSFFNRQSQPIISVWVTIYSCHYFIGVEHKRDTYVATGDSSCSADSQIMRSV